MHVDVIEHARAGRLSQVDADVHAVRLICLGERDLGPLREDSELLQLVRLETGKRCLVPIRHDHEVAVVVGIEIEDDETGLARVNDQRLAILGGVGHRAEHTP
jgi:hypothetical protein